MFKALLGDKPLMMIHVLPLAIFAYLLFRFALPLAVPAPVKALIGLALFLATQQHLLMRYLAGGLAAPELPVPVLLGLGWLFVCGLLLLFLVLARDIALLCRRLWSGQKRLWKKPAFSTGRRQALAVACLAAVPAAYGVKEAVALPEVRDRQAAFPNLPEELDGLSVVQISDLHVSPLLQRDYVRAVVDRTNALNPDLILITGDTVDGSLERRASSVAPLKDLRARHGIFACTGNHEYYGGYAEWMRALPELGLNMLLNGHRVLNIKGQQLVIAGVTDEAADRFGLPLPDCGAALKGAPGSAQGAFRILLDHRPGRAQANAAQGVDLQLSGHTHGGHILGFNRLVGRFNSGYIQGWYQVDRMRLYVSSGAGLWNGFPVRLGVPS
ncbi:metallophosphoesterase, partial [Desulfovibrio sp. OttesenSCG-928-C14]|nr:metallophosphoesterase [Desulfovibrio sp. OttesenSCG-928-C14]